MLTPRSRRIRLTNSLRLIPRMTKRPKPKRKTKLGEPAERNSSSVRCVIAFARQDLLIASAVFAARCSPDLAGTGKAIR